MQEIILKFLEMSRHLESAYLGEFDFGKLKTNLDKLKKLAPTILKVEEEHKLLREFIAIKALSKIKILKLNGLSETGQLDGDKLNQMDAQSLIDYDLQLSGAVNSAFSSRPRFRKTISPIEKQTDNNEYKIGG